MQLIIYLVQFYDISAQQYILQQYKLYNLTFTSAEQCLKCLIIVLPLAYVLPISFFIYSSS